MQSITAQTVLACLHTLLDESGRTIAEWLQIRYDMHIDDMRRSQRRQHLVLLLPVASRLIGRQTFAVIFPHRIQIRIQGHRLLHGIDRIAIVAAQDDRRFFGQTGCLDTILHSGNDRLHEPFGLRRQAAQRLAQANHQSDMRIGLDKLRDGLSGIVRHQRMNTALMRIQAMIDRKLVGNMNIIELEHDPDTSAITLLRQPHEDLVIHLQLFLGDFQRLRIIGHLHQRRKRMSTPDIQHITTVFHHHIQVLFPLCLVIEPGETIRRDWILVGSSRRFNLRLLQSQNRASQFIHRRVAKSQFIGNLTRLVNPLGKFQQAIHRARVAAAGNHCQTACYRAQIKALSLGNGTMIQEQLFLLQILQKCADRPVSRIDLHAGQIAILLYLCLRDLDNLIPCFPQTLLQIGHTGCDSLIAGCLQNDTRCSHFSPPVRSKIHPALPARHSHTILRSAHPAGFPARRPAPVPH